MWFDFGPEGVLQKALADAGFREINVAKHSVVQQIKDGEEYWQGVVGTSGRLQMLLERIPPEVGSSISNQVIRTVEKFRTAEGVKIPCEALLSWARK